MLLHFIGHLASGVLRIRNHFGDECGPGKRAVASG
jgi:hypothetical protein